MGSYKIASLPGDGIGPEIVAEARRVMDAVGARFEHQFAFTEALVGGAAIDATGHPLPESTKQVVLESDAVLFGAVGGPPGCAWDRLPPELRPELGALLPLRKLLQVYANLRPVKTFLSMLSGSPLKESVMGDGVDILIVRELTGGLYFGQPKGRRAGQNGTEVVDTLVYSDEEIRRILGLGFELARKRSKRLCSVDKANVLESSRLWREIATEMGKEYHDVELTHMYVDNCAIQLIIKPRQFDVIVTENMFGDILSDEAAALTGSLGMLPSASIGLGKVSFYEPIHGSAPDIAGQKKANPLATILTSALLLRYSFGLEQEAVAIERAVAAVLDQGYRTGDIYEPGATLVGTRQMGDLVIEALQA